MLCVISTTKEKLGKFLIFLTVVTIFLRNRVLKHDLAKQLCQSIIKVITINLVLYFLYLFLLLSTVQEIFVFGMT